MQACQNEHAKNGLNAPENQDAESQAPAVTVKELEQLVIRLENCGLTEYLKVSGNKRKVLLLNFMSGIARGLGFTVGTAMVLAIVYKVIATIVSMNIPYLTELLTDFVEFIKGVQ